MSQIEPDRHAAPESAPGPVLAPVTPSDRLFELDMLRGWAVLGILAANAIAFAWPAMLALDPSAAPFAMAGADKIGQWVVDTFVENKFRTLFSLLFGVSVFLVGGERDDEARGSLLKRRLWWLALIGVVHGAGFWFGDILLHYAMCGFIVMTLRSWPAEKLLWIGGGVTAAWAVIGAGFAVMGAMMGAEAAPPPDLPFMPTPERILALVEVYRSSWSGAATQNLIAWAIGQGFSLLLIPATVPLMMLGLGLFKSGVLVGRGPTWLYLLAVALGAVALALNGWAAWRSLGSGDPAASAMAEAAQTLAPLAMLGYVAALLLLGRWGFRAVTAIFAPVGRMAFTNYLAQTLIMVSLFYMPWGPRLFGEWGPAMLWAPVLAIWAAQLIWSPLWLRAFRMGPLEWLWRCLTYGRWLPIRR